MKKIILLGIISLGLCSATVQPSEAGIFHWWKNRKYSTWIMVRPYNAFTPVCYGRINCDGCCPVQTGHSMPYPAMMPPMWGQMGAFGHFPPPSCCTSGCWDPHCLPAPDAVSDGTDSSPSPTEGDQPNYTPPAPTPLPTMSQYPAPAPYQAAAYPGYYPSYYPGYHPWMTPVSYQPNYWNGYGAYYPGR